MWYTYNSRNPEYTYDMLELRGREKAEEEEDEEEDALSWGTRGA